MSIRLTSWNVNGIRAVERKGLFTPFVESLRPDIICLQEIKATPEQVEIELPGYEQIWHPASRKGYSGTAVFSKLATSSTTLGLPGHLVNSHGVLDDGFGDPNDEGRVITVEYDDFFLVTSYTPNAKGDLSRLELRHKRWDPAFRAHLLELEKVKPVIACGDLNVAHTEDDLANPKTNRNNPGFTDQEREGFQALLDDGFVDTFRMFTSGPGHYSWWSHRAGARTRNIGWRIDYFIVSASLAPSVLAAEIHQDILGSDHCPVSLTLA